MAETVTAKPAPKLGRATVARGRTVSVPHPTEKVFVGRLPETGAERFGPKMIDYGPGQEVELPHAEIAELRAKGFLIDPGAVQHQVASGPNFDLTQPHA
jgi:hypothetical protein